MIIKRIYRKKGRPDNIMYYDTDTTTESRTKPTGETTVIINLD